MPCNTPAPPSSGSGANDPCDSSTTTCPQCTYWSQDHRTEVNAARTKYLSSTQSGTRQVKYRFEGNLASVNIRITVILKLGTLDPLLTAAEITRVKTDFKTVVGPAWSNKFSVKVTDPVCGEKTLPILVRVLWNADDTSDAHHYTVNVTTAAITANVTGSVVTLNYQDDVVDHSGWVMTHEFGHTFGLADEYFYAGVTSASITYNLADASTEVVTLEPADNSIMQTHSNTTILKRFFYLAAIEAQELFRQKSGRSVVCEVV